MKDRKRCVIIGGAPIGNYERARSYLKEKDFIIYCDAGLRHFDELKTKPDLIIGDFDSLDPGILNRIDNVQNKIIRLSPVKDDSDTGHAVTLGLQYGFNDFLLLGMLGRRIDHSLANIYLLLRLYRNEAKALMVDDFSELSIIGGDKTSVNDSFPFFSLINITGNAHGVTIKNAKYPLKDAEIPQINSDLTISNEVLSGKSALISIEKGELLLIRDIAG